MSLGIASCIIYAYTRLGFSCWIPHVALSLKMLYTFLVNYFRYSVLRKRGTLQAQTVHSSRRKLKTVSRYERPGNGRRLELVWNNVGSLRSFEYYILRGWSTILTICCIRSANFTLPSQFLDCNSVFGSVGWDFNPSLINCDCAIDTMAGDAMLNWFKIRRGVAREFLRKVLRIFDLS